MREVLESFLAVLTESDLVFNIVSRSYPDTPDIQREKSTIKKLTNGY